MYAEEVARWRRAAQKLRDTNLPQIKGHMWDMDNDGNYVAACALGAMYIEAGMSSSFLSVTPSSSVNPLYIGTTHWDGSRYVSITNLNDTHGLTFAQIADIIDSVCSEWDEIREM